MGDSFRGGESQFSEQGPSESDLAALGLTLREEAGLGAAVAGAAAQLSLSALGCRGAAAESLGLWSRKARALPLTASCALGQVFISLTLSFLVCTTGVVMLPLHEFVDTINEITLLEAVTMPVT